MSTDWSSYNEHPVQHTMIGPTTHQTRGRLGRLQFRISNDPPRIRWITQQYSNNFKIHCYSNFESVREKQHTYMTKLSTQPQRCAHKHFPSFVGTPEGDGGGRQHNVNVTRCITASSDHDVVMMSPIPRVQCGCQL